MFTIKARARPGEIIFNFGSASTRFDLFFTVLWMFTEQVKYLASLFLASPAMLYPSMLFVAVGVTSVVQWSIFVQGKERGVEQHGVVVLHDNPLVLCLDPWLVLIG